MSKMARWLAAATAVFAVSVAVGCFSAVKTDPELLYDYFAELSGGEISIMTGTAAISALIMWAVLFFSAFFKFGAVTVSLAVGTRGFIDGFAVTAILRILGFKAVGMCFSDIIGAPIALVMSAAVICALNSEEYNMAAYLAVSGICLLLFLASALISSALSGALVNAVIKGIAF